MDGYYDWVKEHIEEVNKTLDLGNDFKRSAEMFLLFPIGYSSIIFVNNAIINLQGAPLNEADHCGDPPLLLAAGNGHLTCCKLLLDEGADIEQRNVVSYIYSFNYQKEIHYMLHPFKGRELCK